LEIIKEIEKNQLIFEKIIKDMKESLKKIENLIINWK